MEIELKYLLKDRAQADEIFDSDMVKNIEDEESFETIDMHSVYYDTEDQSLTSAGIAVRVRKEGDLYVATMKDKGESVEGMHRREEINVRLTDDSLITAPDISIFSESSEYESLKAIAKDSKLVPVLEMKFERRQVRVDTGKSISVLSCDDGMMIAGEKTMPLMELEIELYSGEEDDMKALGEKIAERYGLVPENRSKFERGYSMVDLTE